MQFTDLLRYGLVNGPGGQHNSRTIMLKELRSLLAACPPTALVNDYRSAIITDNILLKGTMSTRVKTWRGMRELYSLDLDVLLFRAMRDLWDDDHEAQPLLAMLCAIARDPLLRGTVDLILDTPTGAVITPQMFADADDAAFPGHYKSGVLGVTGRNVASSWEQSGHLQGRQNKVRARANCRPTALVYALLLGHLCDARGEGLFHTPWARLLDAPTDNLRAQAIVASQQGWIEYRHSGHVTEIGFRHLLRDLTEVSPT